MSKDKAPAEQARINVRDESVRWIREHGLYPDRR